MAAEDIDFFRPMVLDACSQVKELWGAVDEYGDILGFMGCVGNRVEMLFVAPAFFGRGIGSTLLIHGIRTLGATSVDVNEQNHGATAFYLHHGFEVAGRSPVDGTGKPYPLLHLRLPPKACPLPSHP
nr:GNAT family N-acetyltransferase [Pseudodesulfovibrio alkaliphilus]